MKTQNLALGFGVIAVALLGGWFGGSFSSEPVDIDKLVNELKKESPTLGAVSSLEGIGFPFIGISGNNKWWNSSGFNATSSILCAFQNPFGATSTLDAFHAMFINNTFTAAQTFDLSTSSNAYASSSPSFIRAYSVAGGLKDAISWGGGATSTGTLLLGVAPATGARNWVIGPTEWITLRTATSSPVAHASYSTGKCSIELTKLP